MALSRVLRGLTRAGVLLVSGVVFFFASLFVLSGIENWADEPLLRFLSASGVTLTSGAVFLYAFARISD